jgi:hypothetical protein
VLKVQKISYKNNFKYYNKEEYMFLREKKPAIEPLLAKLEYPNSLRNYPSPEGRDLFLIMGSSGSGVSTFANYMAGCQMEARLDRYGEEFLEAKNEQPCKTSARAESTTFFPQVVLAKNNLELLDCPAYDYNSTKKQIAILATQQAILQAKSIRGIVIVLHYNELKYSRFNDLLDYLKKTFHHMPKDSILFFVNKAPHTIKPHHMLQSLKEQAEHESKYSKGKTNAQDLYKLIKDHPEKLQLFDPQAVDSRPIIDNQLQALKPMPKEYINIPGYKEAEELELRDRLKFLNMDLSKAFKIREDLILTQLDLSLSSDEKTILQKKLADVERTIKNLSDEIAMHSSFVTMIAKTDDTNVAQYIQAHEKNTANKIVPTYDNDQSLETSIKLRSSS